MNKETILLFKLSEDLYRNTILPDIRVSEVHIDRFLRHALKNNVLFHTAKKLLEDYSLNMETRKQLQTILDKGNGELLEIQRSIKDIKKHIEGYLIFKTFRGDHFSRIGNDIDVLIRKQDIDPIKRKFLLLGFHTDVDDPKEKSVGLLRAGRKKIHLQGGITWCWTEYLDEALIYQNPRTVIYNGQEIYVPNSNADFLIHLAHMNFEPLHMILSEILYLFNLGREIDFHIIQEQARKYHWLRTLLRTLNVLNNLHRMLYGELLTTAIQFKLLDLSDMRLPYIFSRTHITLTALEKRLFIYPLTRLFKVLRVLLTSDTYRYVDSPERQAIL